MVFASSIYPVAWSEKCPSLGNQEKRKKEEVSIYSLLFCLLNGTLKVLAFDKIRNVILIFVILLALAFLLLETLVALGKLAERGKAVGAKLVQDTGDELGELLLLAVTVDGKGVGGNGGVDWNMTMSVLFVLLFHNFHIFIYTQGRGVRAYPWGWRSG